MGVGSGAYGVRLAANSIHGRRFESVRVWVAAISIRRCDSGSAAVLASGNIHPWTTFHFAWVRETVSIPREAPLRSRRTGWTPHRTVECDNTWPARTTVEPTGAHGWRTDNTSTWGQCSITPHVA